MTNDLSIGPRRKYRDRPSVASLYSGCGGLDIGFRWAGFELSWANDLDPFALDTYRSVLPGHPAIEGDLSSLSDRPGRKDVDVVIGGPPCQGFSVAGRMDPDDPRSREVSTFFDVVEEIHPRAFVMENVKALASNQRWSGIIEQLIERSRDLGFATSLYVLNAADFGVAQSRERTFIVGIRKKHGSPAVPIPTTAGDQPTLRSALESLPIYGDPGNDLVCTARITTAKDPVLRRSPWAGMLFNGAGRPMDLESPAPTLPASMGGNKTPIVDQRWLVDGKRPWVVDYHRHLWEGGSPVKKVPARLRRITVQEAAEIQSFPKGVRWAGPQSAQYRQIGNAVPPELAFRIALSVRRGLDLDAGKKWKKKSRRRGV